MTATRQNPLRMIGKQIQRIMSVSPFNSPEHKQLADARVIESYDSVPGIYQEFFLSHLSKGQAFPYVVLTPACETSVSKITGKLLCTIDHTLYVLEENQTNMKEVCYPIDEINYVEVTHCLSNLFVKIDGVTNLGISTASIFGCSNTTDKIFTPLFQRIRLRVVSLNEKAPSRHLDRLDRWNAVQSRVMDMARHCLLAGETVVHAILQPEIRGSLFSNLDGILHGMRYPAHICVLTDKELVLIREDPSQGRKDPRGSVCNFIPLNKIASFSTGREKGNILTVSFQLSNGELFGSLFDTSLENDVNQFLAQTRELMPAERSYFRD